MDCMFIPEVDAWFGWSCCCCCRSVSVDAATPLAVAAARPLAGVAPTAAGTAETAALVVALPAA